MESDLDVIMAGTWMLCGNGWSLIWTLSWLAYGCSAGMDGLGSGRYYGWHIPEQQSILLFLSYDFPT